MTISYIAKINTNTMTNCNTDSNYTMYILTAGWIFFSAICALTCTALLCTSIYKIWAFGLQN